MELIKYIDSTNLKADATMRDIEKLCDEALKYHLDKVVVHPYYVSLATSLLKESSVEVECVVGYPTGMSTTSTKAYEAIEAINNGASSIALVLNIAAIKNHNFEDVKEEIEEIRDSIDGHPLTISVNQSSLTEEELVTLTKLGNDTFINGIQLENNDDFEKLIKDCLIVKDHKIDLLELKVSGEVVSNQSIEEWIDQGINHIEVTDIKKIMEGK